MLISDLSLDEIFQRLKRSELRFQAGIYTICVYSPYKVVAEGLKNLYQDYHLVDLDTFCDFYLAVKSPGLVRRWFRPQVVFSHDGFSPFKPLPADHAFALFEWAFNWCVGNHAHNFLLLHAAVVEKNGKALVLPAPPGSGKSTLSASLVAHGWRLLSDELTIIDPDTLLAVPFPRPVSLKNYSIDVISVRFPDMYIGRKSYDTTKGTVAHMRAPTDSVFRGSERVPIRWIVFPKYEAGSETKFETKEKGQTLIETIENSFNYDLLGRVGFDVLTQVIQDANCYRFQYSNIDEALQLFDSIAEGEQ
ncbi:MAG: HprK-related kinase A [Gammaproteobacteria bacterium]|nr:HprK-related kinase A [Gammaproteobacteria bacterium]